VVEVAVVEWGFVGVEERMGVEDWGQD